ncbi:MAG: hypothetical protein COU35_00385 [Candidatus Magasanikbacteria bacterium CG10_big_fil_rev_8_21_14_0_10_47_10]|uniref:Uncharacterized protein n=1 Tax=Candidatus Magasanikbacteria bacterium CG10_big_fil_rev_8_21_14_0_10_47_10 TaxID=1974652 RepID=A0A2H0TRP4_9BACT|nr:MAG: hypothetical protein COU35_00385 [Candidatus Magasanikbacteria bacterium CG10_big_fil_rev_8_21_14_0_10_47_10]
MMVLKSEKAPHGDVVIKQGTAEYAQKIAEGFGADPKKVEDIIQDLHKSGPWAAADRLSAATDPEIKTYLTLAAACQESGWPGYDPAGYMEDRKRVVKCRY